MNVSLETNDYLVVFQPTIQPSVLSVYGSSVPCEGKPREQLANHADLTFSIGQLMAEIKKALQAAIDDKAQTKAQTKGNSYLPKSRERRRHDRLAFQLEVFDLYMNGQLVWEIAKQLHTKPSTVKSALAVAMELTGVERAKHGKAWFTHHKKTCANCNGKEAVNYACRLVAQRIRAFGEARQQRRAESAKSYIPPMPVKSEKSAFAKWDAQHPEYPYNRS
jgi:DNA-binding NarL/FixJ family response regulator